MRIHQHIASGDAMTHLDKIAVFGATPLVGVLCFFDFARQMTSRRGAK
jgi:hypothetical protein